MVGVVLVFLICLTIGLITAFVGSIMGLGGGIILIPTLLLVSSFLDSFSWVTPQSIVGISLIAMIVTALSSTLSYAKVKRVDYKTGLLFLTGSIPGGAIGSWLNQFVDSKSFLLYFGILMIVISLLFFIKRDRNHKRNSLGMKKVSVHLNYSEKHIDIVYRS